MFKYRCDYLPMVLLPLLIAGGIYFLFRVSPPQTIIDLTRWMNYSPVSLGDGWDWFVYSVPDGLWAFSFSSFLLIETRNASKITRFTYSVVGLVLMIMLEALQGTHLDGTFDKDDVAAVVIGFGISHALMHRNKND